MKKQKQNSYKKTDTKPQQPQQLVAEKSLSWIKLTSKALLLLAIAVSVVIYTDKKEYFVGDQSNNHGERKWRSFYRFADKQRKNADIVIFGNSHASAGVEPYIVSMATGTYCFILNSAGTTAMDAYFNLKEVLAHHNKPKLVILETFCLDGLELGHEWGRIQSFEAKEASWHKLKSMPFIFQPDEWVKAWSPTIRNHSFLLTDTARIAYNIKNVGKEKNPDRTSFDLGRFSHGSNYLQDSMLVKYDSLGAPVKSDRVKIHKNNRKYLKKLYNLCMENDIKLLLLTVPMYYKSFDDYSILKAKYAELFREIPQAEWLDLQHPYDTLLYVPKAFNNEYSSAQHLTYHGMTITAYKLSEFILKNCAGILPNRQNEKLWIDDFKSQPHFVFNCDVAPEMKEYSSIAKDRNMGKFHIKELVLQEMPEVNRLILKLENHPELTSNLIVQLKIEYQDNIFTTPIEMQAVEDVFPPQHKVYIAGLVKEVKVLGIQ